MFIDRASRDQSTSTVSGTGERSGSTTFSAAVRKAQRRDIGDAQPRASERTTPPWWHQGWPPVQTLGVRDFEALTNYDWPRTLMEWPNTMMPISALIGEGKLVNASRQIWGFVARHPEFGFRFFHGAGARQAQIMFTPPTPATAALFQVPAISRPQQVIPLPRPINGVSRIIFVKADPRVPLHFTLPPGTAAPQILFENSLKGDKP